MSIEEVRHGVTRAIAWGWTGPVRVCTDDGMTVFRDWATDRLYAVVCNHDAGTRRIVWLYPWETASQTKRRLLWEIRCWIADGTPGGLRVLA